MATWNLTIIACLAAGLEACAAEQGFSVDASVGRVDAADAGAEDAHDAAAPDALPGDADAAARDAVPADVDVAGPVCEVARQVDLVLGHNRVTGHTRGRREDFELCYAPVDGGREAVIATLPGSPVETLAVASLPEVNFTPTFIELRNACDSKPQQCDTSSLRPGGSQVTMLVTASGTSDAWAADILVGHPPNALEANVALVGGKIRVGVRGEDLDGDVRLIRIEYLNALGESFGLRVFGLETSTITATQFTMGQVFDDEEPSARQLEVGLVDSLGFSGASLRAPLVR